MAKKPLNIRETLEQIRNQQLSPKEGFQLLQKLRQTDTAGTLLYYRKEWKQTEITPAAHSLSGQVLLFDTKEPQAFAATGVQIVRVKSGTAFVELGNREYEINPASQDDYKRLIATLKQQGFTPDQIVHLWSQERFDTAEDTLRSQLASGVYSLLYLTQALLEQNPRHKAGMVYLYATDGEVQPANAALGGFAKSLRQENPNLACKTVEIAADAGTSLLELALKELQAPADVEVRYQNGTRFVNRLNPCGTSPENTPEPTKFLPLKDGGVYVITGGAGGLGLVFAEYLAGRVPGAKLVLTGRSELDADKRRKLKKLEQSGAEIVYERADVTQREDVMRLASDIKERFGAINGIVHSAGVLRDSFVIKKTREEMDAVLAAKVYGTVNLHEAMAGEQLDFYVMFSSITSLLGNVGQVDYAYGNGFMDHFAARMTAEKSATRYLSINWPLWNEGGMGIEEATVEWLSKTMGIVPLGTENGLKAFEDALKSSLPQLLVVEGNAEKFHDYLNPSPAVKTAEPTEPTQEADLGDEATERLRTKTESFLKGLLSKQTKLPVNRIDAHTSLESYGIDSVMIMGLTRELESVFGELPKTLFFEYQNIAELTGYLMEDHLAKLMEQVGEKPAARTKKPAGTASEVKETARTSRGRFAAAPAVQTPTASEAERDDIAIIGVSGRYPMAKNLQEFWENFKSGRDCITDIPADRWDFEQDYDPDRKQRGKSYGKWGGFLDDVDKFDPLFFAISPKEAEVLDPQERLFLQTVWHTIEDSGYTRERLGKQKVGVFVGVMYGHYQLYGAEETLRGNRMGLNSSFASIANRVSYVFNFHGPCIALDTMCSSSLTAIHLACESLYRGESQVAVAGGVNVSIHPNKYIALSAGNFLSSDGRCRAFGADGDGYVPGEGVGAVLLKPLKQAVAEGDRIYAVIKASSINHGGKTNGYTVPNPTAQGNLIAETLKKAQINPRTISYMEAHGTGTSLGDPIEINGLVRAFKEYTTDAQYCSIGSAKSNIGHLESAAGIAGLTKILLQLQHKQLVPSLHSDTLNPHINFQETPFYVQHEMQEWKRPVLLENGVEKEYPRRAAISAFGAGGSNAHLILEEYEAPATDAYDNDGEPQLILLSARSESRLNEYAHLLAAYLEQDQRNEHASSAPLSDIAFTLQTGREAMDVRLAIVAASKDELLHKLREVCAHKEDIPGVLTGDLEQSAQQALVLKQDSEDLDYIHSVVRKGNLDKISAMWVTGAPIDWSLLDRSHTPRPIRLPVYPFEQTRYWVPVSKNAPVKLPQEQALLLAGLHPLVDSNESTLDVEVFKKSLRADEFFIHDHIVSGQAILPGTAYLEMVRAAGELAAKRPVFEIREVMWVRPIVVSAASKDVYIVFYPALDDVEFEVFSEEAGERVLHSSGRIRYEEQVAAEDFAPRKFDIQEIRNRCRLATRHHAELYAIFKEMGFDYGPAFQVTQEVFCGEREVLAKLVLPDAFAADLTKYQLHPALMDGALRATFGIGNSYLSKENPNVPFALDKLQIFRALPKVCYVHGTLSSEDGSMYDPITKLHITLMDESGHELVRLREFAAREFQQQQAETRLHYYQPNWQAAPLLVAEGESRTDTILVWEDADGTFKPDGTGSKQFIFVRPGDEYRAVDHQLYYLNPADPEHYHRLMRELHANGVQSNGMLHLWNLNRPVDLDDCEDEQKLFGRLASGMDTGLYSMMYLFQAVTEHMPDLRTRCLYVFTGGRQAESPLHEALSGFANAITPVNHRFELISLQMEAGAIAPQDIAGILLQELDATANSNGSEICLARDGRFVRSIQPLAAQPAGQKREDLQLKTGGVYLVTGGAGGLGMIFARYLAEKYQSRLVLTGRTELKPSIEDKLQQLRQLGAQDAMYLRADVSELGDVQNVVRECKTKFGAINGIFHVAGVAGETRVTELDKAAFEKIILPKVNGTINLDLATRNDSLDLFVLFSSISALVGDFGACNYSVANSFMDRYAIRRDQLRADGLRSGSTISINWPLWNGGGLELSEEDAAMYFATSGMRILDAQTGLAAFEAALVSGAPQLVAVSGDAERINKLLKVASSQAVEEQEEEEQFQPVEQPECGRDASSFEALLLEETEAYLKEQVSETIKLPTHMINSRAPLEKYGIDSIMIMELNKLLERDFPALPKTLFFEYKNLADLAHYFVKNHAGKMTELRGLKQEETKTAPAPVAKKPAPAPQPQAAVAITRSSRFAKEQPRMDAPAAQAPHAYEDIAIIGISGKYPMANNLDEYWENLKNGRDCITEIPLERWDYRKYYDPQKGKSGKMYSKWGGFLNQVDQFDPLFFNMSPRDAEQVDPQERLFLETAWQTIEDAGYARTNLSGRSIGVFVGAMYSQYQLFGVGEQNMDLVPGSFFSSIANRVSYVMNFSGPSLTVDTACSSSLEAIRLGCQNIWSGACEMAIAGGVNVTIHPHKYLFLCQSNFLSSDGKCRSFGAGGDGYVPGEGVGAVLLKPLRQAVADGDHIYAVIKGISINHGGKTNGYTVPNPTAQGELIASAMKAAKIDARTISYVEAHGTGTPLGDPIEVTGLTNAFREFTQDRQYCSLGSVKSNIGHCESAAGISGITKVLLQMKHKTLAPTLHAETINPNISFDATPFYLQREAAEWKQPVIVENGKAKTYPRRASISGFGAGGTNVHIILEEYAEPVTQQNDSGKEPHLVVLSAKSADRLNVYAKRLASVLEQTMEPVSVKQQGNQERLLTAVKQDVADLVSSVLSVEKHNVDYEETITEYGFDTILFNTLSNQLNSRYDINTEHNLFTSCSSVSEISDYLVANFGHALHRKFSAAEVAVATTAEQTVTPIRLSELSYTLQVGREPMKERLAFVVTSVAELRDKLLAFCNHAGTIEGVYTGSVKPGSEEAESLVEGKEGEAFVRSLINGKKLDKIAKLWTQGVEIDWQLFYTSQRPKRLSLPSYPFAGERYWPKHTAGVATRTAEHSDVARLHPLIERNASNLQGTKFSTSFTGREWFLTDDGHGHKGLPAIALLEMLRAAGEIAGEQQVSRITDIEWDGSVAIPCRAKEALEVLLLAGDENVECEISTAGQGQASTVYARALLKFEQQHDVRGSRYIPIDAIQQTCTVASSPVEFAAVKECRRNETEAISLLQVPQSQQSLREEYVLHPALLAGMVQTIAILINADGEPAVDSVGELEIWGTLPDRCYVHAETVAAGDDAVVFDVQFADEAGQVLVTLTDLSVRTVGTPAGDHDMIEMLRKLQTGELSANAVKQYMGVK